MKKVDNDPVLFCLGSAKNGYDGVFKENMAYFRKWVIVTIDVDIQRKFITWKMADKIMAQGYVRQFNSGGYFGIYMTYERNTQFDDVKITVVETD